MHSITREELKRKLEKNESFVLLEISDRSSFEEFHLPKAKNVPLHAANFSDLVRKMAPDKKIPIVVYSWSVKSEVSGEAADALEEMGYREVLEYVEGKEDWLHAGYPVVEA